jgi:hypothetical protein
MESQQIWEFNIPLPKKKKAASCTDSETPAVRFLWLYRKACSVTESFSGEEETSLDMQ